MSAPSRYRLSPHIQNPRSFDERNDKEEQGETGICEIPGYRMLRYKRIELTHKPALLLRHLLLA